MPKLRLRMIQQFLQSYSTICSSAMGKKKKDDVQKIFFKSIDSIMTNQL